MFLFVFLVDKFRRKLPTTRSICKLSFVTMFSLFSECPLLLCSPFPVGMSSLRATCFLYMSNSVLFVILVSLIVLDYALRSWRSTSALEYDLVLQDVVSSALWWGANTKIIWNFKERNRERDILLLTENHTIVVEKFDMTGLFLQIIYNLPSHQKKSKEGKKEKSWVIFSTSRFPKVQYHFKISKFLH